MMKRSILLLPILLALSACGSSATPSAVTCDQQFWNGVVAVCLPSGWRALSSDALAQLGVPEETVAAFQYETPHAGQTDTVTVTRETLSSDLSTTEYATASQAAVSGLPEYKQIDTQAVTIDGSETTLHVFSARITPDQPVRRYYQVSAAANRIGYTFTGSFPLSIADTEAAQVEFILKNVSLKEPTKAK